MVKLSDINIVLKRLQKLLYGYNYEVEIEVRLLENCATIDEFPAALKAIFPDARPESNALVPMTPDDFWAGIEFALNYRGDDVAGVVVAGKKIEQFTVLKQTLFDLLRERINAESKIFSYPDLMGIPGYPVWWDFRFVIFSNNADAIFIFGAASD